MNCVIAVVLHQLFIPPVTERDKSSLEAGALV